MEKKIVFCVSGRQEGGNESLKKKKSTWNTLMGLNELKEVIQMVKDVNLDEFCSVCEL